MKRPGKASRRQLALGLLCEPKYHPAEQAREQLVQALADLLLQALGEDANQATNESGGGDEP